MADFEKNLNNDNPEEIEDMIYTLTDEETGEDIDLEVLASVEIEGTVYVAFVPAGFDEATEFVILRQNEDGEDITFETIDDDDEFDRIADLFNDVLFNEIDYDN